MINMGYDLGNLDITEQLERIAEQLERIANTLEVFEQVAIDIGEKITPFKEGDE